MNKTSKRIYAIGLPLVLVVATGAAVAYFTGSGSGTGTASTSTGGAGLTVTQNAISGLAPGVAAQTISGTVSNNTGQSAYVTAVTASVTSVTQAAGAVGGCDATDYALASESMAVNQDVATGSSAGFSGATLVFVNKTSNQDGCKGATVNLSYAVS